MEVDRLKVLLYNAIALLREASWSPCEICMELGMSEEEYTEVMLL